MQLTAAPISARKQRFLLFSICIVTFLLPLDITVLAAALPAMQTEWRAGFHELQWIVNSYNIVFTAALPVAGSIADRLGPQRCFVASVLAFAAISLTAGMADSSSVLIAARAVQGAVASLILVSALATLNVSYTGAAAARAFAYWGCAIGAGAAFGPTIGAFLVDSAGWRWIFFLNLLIAVPAVQPLLAWLNDGVRHNRAIPETPPVIAITLWLLTLCFAATEGNGLGWSHPLIIASEAVIVILLLRAIHWRVKAGFIVSRYRQFQNATIVGALMGFAFWSLFVYWPAYFLALGKHSFADIAIVMAPMTLPLLLLPPLGARLAALHSPARLQAMGMIALSCGIAWLLYVRRFDNLLLDGIPMLLCGCAMGLVNSEITNVALQEVPATHSGLASGMNMVARHGALTLGIAVHGAILVAAITMMAVNALPPDILLDQASITLISLGKMSEAAQAIGSAGGVGIDSKLRHLFLDAFRFNLLFALISSLLAALIAAVGLRRRTSMP